jgi:methylenetetrahydrofolate reductase (NADPH)
MRTHVPGLSIPDAVISRLAGAADQAREGRNICVELVQELRTIEGVSGVHIMAYRQEESVAEVIDRSGVLGGRRPWRPHAPDVADARDDDQKAGDRKAL